MISPRPARIRVVDDDDDDGGAAHPESCVAISEPAATESGGAPDELFGEILDDLWESGDTCATLPPLGLCAELQPASAESAALLQLQEQLANERYNILDFA